MSILKRFGRIMSSNINELFSKGDSTEKEIESYLHYIDKDLQELMVESVTIAEEEGRRKRVLNEFLDEKYKIERYLKRAEENKDYSRARGFEDSLNSMGLKEKALKEQYDLAFESLTRIKTMEEKLRSDLLELKSRVNNVQATFNKAKGMGDKSNISSGSLGNKISSLEDKAERKLVEAEALEELNDLSGKTKEDQELDRLFRELEES